MPKLGPLGGEEEEPAPVKIPIRDRRKLYEQESDADMNPVAPEPQTQTQDQPTGTEADSAAVQEAEAKAKGYLEDLQRLQAEFDNYRRRTAREQGQLREFVAGEIVGRLLGVLDNFQLAVSAAEDTRNRDFEAMSKGVQMVFRDLKNALEDIGLEPVNAVGRVFDPNLHEAVEESEGDGSGVMAVEQIFRDGYMFKGAVLRPALVKVTQDAQAADEPDD